MVVYHTEMLELFAEKCQEIVKLFPAAPGLLAAPDMTNASTRPCKSTTIPTKTKHINLF